MSERLSTLFPAQWISVRATEHLMMLAAMAPALLVVAGRVSFSLFQPRSISSDFTAFVKHVLRRLQNCNGTHAQGSNNDQSLAGLSASHRAFRQALQQAIATLEPESPRTASLMQTRVALIAVGRVRLLLLTVFMLEGMTESLGYPSNAVTDRAEAGGNRERVSHMTLAVAKFQI